ncbi:MAG: SdpI family protein [Blautia sp.]
MLDTIISFVICLTIPGVMFLGGILLKIYQPKMNNLIGYRSHLSMLNETTWKYANQYLAKVWLLLGGIEFFISIIITTYIYLKKHTIEDTICLIIIIIQMLILVISLISIEKKLNTEFDMNGNKK